MAWVTEDKEEVKVGEKNENEIDVILGENVVNRADDDDFERLIEDAYDNDDDDDYVDDDDDDESIADVSKDDDVEDDDDDSDEVVLNISIVVEKDALVKTEDGNYRVDISMEDFSDALSKIVKRKKEEKE